MWATNVQRTVTQICVHLSADASKVQASLALAGKFGIAASFADIHIHCRDISNRASASPRMSSFSHRIQSDIQFMINCISRFSPLLILSTFHPPLFHRQTGMGASSMFARIGGILAIIINLLHNQSPAVPQLIFGTSALLVAGLALTLPETVPQFPRPLPDRVEEAENRDLRY